MIDALLEATALPGPGLLGFLEGLPALIEARELRGPVEKLVQLLLELLVTGVLILLALPRPVAQGRQHRAEGIALVFGCEPSQELLVALLQHSLDLRLHGALAPSSPPSARRKPSSIRSTASRLRSSMVSLAALVSRSNSRRT